MLVIASDIHLFDETVGVLISDKTFSLFASRLRELAYQASWRAGGNYQPINAVNILLLGDILDPLQSTRWLQTDPGQPDYIRPWHDPHSPLFIQKVAEITHAILEKNQNAVRVFKQISHGEGIKLPPANRRGKPDLYSRERIAPKVRIHYIVGNHDWFYHLPGPAYDAIRAEIIEALGLSNPPGPFPHAPEHAGDDLQGIFSRYRLVARHGDHYDRMSYNPNLGRNAASISDVYSSEVIYRFPFEINRQLGDELPPKLARDIQRITNVRPLMATPLWLFDQVRRHDNHPAHVKQIKKIWNQVVSDFLDLDIMRQKDLSTPHIRHSLNLIFGLSKTLSLPTLARLSRLVRNHLGQEHLSMARFAHREPAIQSGQAEIAVYGHTHSHEIVSLCQQKNGASENSPLYINTGAWTTFLDYSPQAKTEQKTRPINLLTCIALYREGERQGRRYENWWANFD